MARKLALSLEQFEIYNTQSVHETNRKNIEEINLGIVDEFTDLSLKNKKKLSHENGAHFSLLLII